MYHQQRISKRPNCYVTSEALLEAGLLESFVHNFWRRCVQVGLNRLERVPATDLHHHTWIHLFIDEEPLREPAPEIVA